MKQYIYFLTALLLSLTLLYGQSYFRMDHKHDSEYYKSKTIEILNALEIDSSKLTFTVIGHNMTIEEREARQNIVSFNIEKLHELIIDREALFECVIEAQLSNMSPKEWERITNVHTQMRIAPGWLPCILSLPPISYLAIWIYDRSNFSVVREIPFALFAALSMLCGIITFDVYRNTDGYSVSVQEHIRNNFELKKLFIQIDTVHKLLNTYKYAPLAFQGMRSVEWQRQKIDTGKGESEIENTLKTMLNAFERWERNYPKAYADIRQMGWSQYSLE